MAKLEAEIPETAAVMRLSGLELSDAIQEVTLLRSAADTSAHERPPGWDRAPKMGGVAPYPPATFDRACPGKHAQSTAKA